MSKGGPIEFIFSMFGCWLEALVQTKNDIYWSTKAHCLKFLNVDEKFTPATYALCTLQESLLYMFRLGV